MGCRADGRIPVEKTPDEEVAELDEEMGDVSCCFGDVVWRAACGVELLAGPAGAVAPVEAAAAATMTAAAAAADWRKVRPKVISESA